MGAHNESYLLNKRLTQDQLDKFLKKQQKEDRKYNGHRDGYSGDSQTIDKIELHRKIFTCRDRADKYCLEHSEKWEHGVAVYLNEEPDTKKLQRLKERRDKLNEEIKEQEQKEKNKKSKLKTYIAFWAAS
jgi:hypothetical protein